MKAHTAATLALAATVVLLAAALWQLNTQVSELKEHAAAQTTTRPTQTSNRSFSYTDPFSESEAQWQQRLEMNNLRNNQIGRAACRERG